MAPLRPLSVPFLLRTSGDSHSQAGSTALSGKSAADQSSVLAFASVTEVIRIEETGWFPTLVNCFGRWRRRLPVLSTLQHCIGLFFLRYCLSGWQYLLLSVKYTCLLIYNESGRHPGPQTASSASVEEVAIEAFQFYHQTCY